MQLRELQQQFALTVFGQQSVSELETLIRPNGLESSRRIQVYQNNVRTTLAEVLQAHFSVVSTLVGEGSFQALAQRYAKQHPPSTGNVTDYGGQFPQFISCVPELKDLPYLQDVATVEWAYIEAYHAMDSDFLSLETLASVPESKHAELTFQFVPSVRMLKSIFPIFDIWQFVKYHSDKDDSTLNIDRGGQAVLVLRQSNRVNVVSLTSEEYEFAKQVQNGHSLHTLVQSLMEKFDKFDLQSILHKFFALGTIANINTDESPD